MSRRLVAVGKITNTPPIRKTEVRLEIPRPRDVTRPAYSTFVFYENLDNGTVTVASEGEK